MSFLKGNKSDASNSQKFVRTEQSVTTSTPVKTETTTQDDFENRLQGLKKKVSDTLTFLHQERNDFLPQEDIIIPTRKDDHVSMHIDLGSIKKESKRNLNDVHRVASNEVSDIVKKAEDTVNDLKSDLVSLKKESRKHSDINKELQLRSEEAFKFLENEASSPICAKKDYDSDQVDVIDSNKIVNFKTPDSPTKIPVAKPRQQPQQSKNVDHVLNENRSGSPTECDLLSKIPVSSKGKMKTIKKHSKDPLKEFVQLSKDVNWDETDAVETAIQTADPIVKTTVTRITPIPSPEATKSKIPILHTEALSPKELSEKFDLNQKSDRSKIPIIHHETTRITSPDSIKSFDSNLVSPSSEAKYSVKSSTVDSDSETDSRRSPPLKGILKKTPFRTVGSSSGSDVALHEPGAESSEDESGAYLSNVAYILTRLNDSFSVSLFCYDNV